MSIIKSFSLFFLSFSPLWLSVILIDLKSIFLDHSNNIYTEKISCFSILLLFIISLFIAKNIVEHKNKKISYSYIIVSAKEEKTITIEFLLSYILPLYVFNFTVWSEVILFLIFFCIFTFLCMRHSYFSVNIILELCGYKFYDCNLQNEDDIIVSKILITKKNLVSNINNKITAYPINNEYFIHILNDKNNI